MKRRTLIAIFCFAFICVGSTVAAVFYNLAGAGPGELPVYPGAQNVQRDQEVLSASSPTRHAGEFTLRFETTDPAANVCTYYENWLGSHGWTVSSDPASMPGEPEVAAGKPGSPTLRDVRFLGFSPQFIPQFEVQRYQYVTVVHAENRGKVIRVTIGVVQLSY